MHACMHVCIYVCMYVCMYVCTYVRMYVCTYVRMYACMHVCMYACMHVCMYVMLCYVVLCCVMVYYVRLCYVMYVCMHACMYTYLYWKVAGSCWTARCTAEAAHCCSNPFVAHAVSLYCQPVVLTVDFRADSRLTAGLVLGQNVDHRYEWHTQCWYLSPPLELALQFVTHHFHHWNYINVVIWLGVPNCTLYKLLHGLNLLSGKDVEMPVYRRVDALRCWPSLHALLLLNACWHLEVRVGCTQRCLTLPFLLIGRAGTLRAVAPWCRHLPLWSRHGGSCSTVLPIFQTLRPCWSTPALGCCHVGARVFWRRVPAVLLCWSLALGDGCWAWARFLWALLAPGAPMLMTLPPTQWSCWHLLGHHEIRTWSVVFVPSCGTPLLPQLHRALWNEFVYPMLAWDTSQRTRWSGPLLGHAWIVPLPVLWSRTKSPCCWLFCCCSILLACAVGIHSLWRLDCWSHYDVGPRQSACGRLDICWLSSHRNVRERGHVERTRSMLSAICWTKKSCGNSHDVATVVNKMLTSKTCTNRIVEFFRLLSSKHVVYHRHVVRGVYNTSSCSAQFHVEIVHVETHAEKLEGISWWYTRRCSRSKRLITYCWSHGWG